MCLPHVDGRAYRYKPRPMGDVVDAAQVEGDAVDPTETETVAIDLTIQPTIEIPSVMTEAPSASSSAQSRCQLSRGSREFRHLCWLLQKNPDMQLVPPPSPPRFDMRVYTR